MDARKKKTVLAIVEQDGRRWWRPLGVGVVNADGSIDVRLDGPPLCGALRVRDVEPRAIEAERGA